jgi:hypothetical protein
MGKQVRFFMTHEDEIDFLRHTVRDGNLILDNKSQVLSAEEAIHSSQLILFVSRKNVNINDIKKNGNGYINQMDAEVIEFLRGKFIDSKHLMSGRIWAEFNFYDNAQLRTKSEEFKPMYKSYEKWIKGNFRISVAKDYYIADNAYKSYKKSSLILVDGPKQTVDFA